MRVRLLSLIVLLTLAWAARPDAAHAQSAELRLEGVAADIDAARAGFDIPAVAIAVVADGRVVMARGFGRRGIADETPVDADTRFAIGSCSKAFTSFALGLLVDEGRLAFSDVVSAHDHLLALPEPDDLKRLTVANLLTQRSGLARHDFLWHARPEMTRADFAAAQKYLTMQGRPDARFGYTNSAYILAGRLVDLRAGMTWEDFTARRIFQPLGMTRSNFSSAGLAADANAARATKRASGVNRTVAWRDGRLLGPAGAVNTTAHDMGRWLLLLAGDGVIEGRRILSSATLQALWTPVVDPRDRDPDGGYAMGWRVDAWRGQRRISHSGAVDGFRARVTVFPERGVAIAVMASLGPTQFPDFATRMIAERVLDLPRMSDLAAIAASRRDSEARAAGAEAPPPRGRLQRLGARDASVAAAIPVSAVHGVYAHPAYGDIRIEPSTDGAGLRIAFGTLAGRLDRWRGDSYIAFSDWPDDTLDEGEIRFAAAASGEVTGLTAMIDNDIAPIAFVRTGPLPVAQPRAELTALPTEDPALQPSAPGLIIVLACCVGVAGLVGWRLAAARRQI
jgi:CubicO group peptidase (beta-lactamase class C family)